MTKKSTRDVSNPNVESRNPTAPTLSAAPADAPIDRPVEIVLMGLRPQRRATVSASFSDSGAEWRCEATFEADAKGVVDLTEQAPVEGDYDGVRPMGLIQLATEAKKTTTEDDGDAYRLRLAARVDGTCVAETSVTRRACAPGVERVELDPERTGVVGELFVPAADGPCPSVVTLHGSGGTPQVGFAKALASRGFAALALRYFGEPEPIPDRLAEVPVSYVGRAINWLRRRDCISSSADVGVLGVSRGTELAFLTAARRDDVSTVVAYAPSAYVWPGNGPADGTPPAWTVDGAPCRPVPHPEDEAPTPAETERGTRFTPIFETCIERATDDEREAATLPVEDVEADVLLVAGADDGVWPADRMAETIVERLRDEAAPGEVAHLSYENYGHHAGVPYRPTTGRTVTEADDGQTVVTGGTPEGIADAETHAWRSVLNTLGGTNGPDD